MNLCKFCQQEVSYSEYTYFIISGQAKRVTIFNCKYCVNGFASYVGIHSKYRLFIRDDNEEIASEEFTWEDGFSFDFCYDENTSYVGQYQTEAVGYKVTCDMPIFPHDNLTPNQLRDKVMLYLKLL